MHPVSSPLWRLYNGSSEANIHLINSQKSVSEGFSEAEKVIYRGEKFIGREYSGAPSIATVMAPVQWQLRSKYSSDKRSKKRGLTSS